MFYGMKIISKELKFEVLKLLELSKFLLGSIEPRALYPFLRGDCKPYPNNVNFRNIFLRN